MLHFGTSPGRMWAYDSEWLLLFRNSRQWRGHTITDEIATVMPQRAYLIFGDIEGKLDVLRVECTKCARKGRYNVRKLIEKYGRRANMMKWKEQLNGDCPRRDARSMMERCDLVRFAEGPIRSSVRGGEAGGRGRLGTMTH